MIGRTRWAGAVLASILWLPGLPAAQRSPIEGRWKTIDDRTGEAKSIVVLTLVRGLVEGRVEQVFSPPAPSGNPRCDACSGALKGRPIIAMQVLWGFRKDGSRYKDGHLMDPETGKTYRGTLTLVDNGEKLQVRGYVGISLLGRTQTWVRAPDAPP